jgi:hypothetical protein
MLSRKSRLLVVLITLVAVVAMSMPSEARGGRGGGGRGGAGGGRSSGSGRPSAGPGGANPSKNVGGQVANSSRNLGGNQQLQGALQQATQGGIQQSLGNRAAGGQNLQSTFEQHANQWQQRATGERTGETKQNFQSQIGEFQSGSEPFSPAWYADHPQAWQYTHPHADAAAVATAAGVTAWLGAAYYTPAETGGTSTTVIYQEAPAEETAPQERPAAAMSNVASVAEEWMTLGTYSLVANPGSPPTVMLQLAVDHRGQLKGVYYDSLTNTTHNVSGTLDRNSQMAQWSLDNNPQLTFKAPLNELLKSAGNVEVKLATGPQQWQLVRLEEK